MTIQLAEIVAAHGIKGWVKIKTFTVFPQDITAYGPLSDASGVPIHLKIERILSDTTLLASIESVKTRTEAEALRGIKLCVPKGSLPDLKENEVYYTDLIGKTVVDENQKVYGRVTDVANYGAGDILEITGAEGAFMCTFQDVLETTDEHIKVDSRMIIHNLSWI